MRAVPLSPAPHPRSRSALIAPPAARARLHGRRPHECQRPLRWRRTPATPLLASRSIPKMLFGREAPPSPGLCHTRAPPPPHPSPTSLVGSRAGIALTCVRVVGRPTCHAGQAPSGLCAAKSTAVHAVHTPSGRHSCLFVAFQLPALPSSSRPNPTFPRQCPQAVLGSS